MLKTWFAHEVYVLTPSEIKADERAPKVNVWDALHHGHNTRTFLLLGALGGLLLALALFLKTRPLFAKIGAYIDKTTIFAPDFIRIVFGLSLIFSASHQAVFGPELPSEIFAGNQFIAPLLYVSGIALILGLGTRLFGILTSLFWLFTFFDKGWYMLTYVNYLGESLALILLPRQKFGLDRFIMGAKKQARDRYSDWAMPVARILFGFSLLYAAINVKFITTALSLDVAERYNLAHYFHFDPLFIVLGAALIESLIAVLYILGLAQRLNSIIFVTFLVLSIWFFKESVWPHYLLLGLAIGIFMHKPDVLALDGRFDKKVKG